MEYLAAAAGSIVSGLAQNKYNMDAQEDVQTFQRDMYKHRYQYQMLDMERAGLNPMLSAGAQPPGPPSGGGSSSATFDVVGAIQSAQAMKAKQQDIELSKQQQDLVKSNTAKSDADTLLSLQQAKESQQRQEKLGVEVEDLRNQVRSSSAKAWLSERDVEKTKEAGPKTAIRDWSDNISTSINGLLKKWGFLNETPRHEAERDASPAVQPVGPGPRGWGKGTK